MRRRVMMVIVGVIAALEMSVLMEQIFGRWVEASRVDRLGHVEIFGWCRTVGHGRGWVHGRVKIGVGDSDGCWVGDVVHYWRWTRELSARRVRRLDACRARHFSLGSARREEVTQLSLVATVGSLRWRNDVSGVVQSCLVAAVRGHEELVSFREVARRETGV